jgi:hypothetical protein
MQLSCKWIAVMLGLVGPSTARAERPAGWLFRATPGFGYAWDRDVMCAVEGRMMVGGWFIGKFVTPSLVVGGGLSVGANALPDDGCVTNDDGLRMTIGMMVGPELDWYPFDRNFHVFATAGFATYDHDSMYSAYGAGGTLAVGYDWVVTEKDKRALFGLALQTTVVRLTHDHSMIMPALVMSVAVD